MTVDWTVQVDRDRCVGSGMCVGVAPHLFTLEDGHSRPTTGVVSAVDADVAMAAVECCPMEAITVVDSTSGEPVSGPDGEPGDE